MRASILLRPSMWFFTVAVGVFVAVMVSVARYPDQSSAKPNDCADENEGVLDCTKGGEGERGGGGGGNSSLSIDPDGQEGVFKISGGRGVGSGEETYQQGGEGGHGSLTLDDEGNISGSVSGGGGLIYSDSEKDGGFRGGGRCTYDYNVSDEDYEPECVGKEGFEDPLN